MFTNLAISYATGSDPNQPVCSNIYPLVNKHIELKNHNFSSVNQRIKWPFSAAMLNYQRVIWESFFVSLSLDPDPQFIWMSDTSGHSECLPWFQYSDLGYIQIQNAHGISVFPIDFFLGWLALKYISNKFQGYSSLQSWSRTFLYTAGIFMSKYHFSYPYIPQPVFFSPLR
jgi:hypothetical protein